MARILMIGATGLTGRALAPLLVQKGHSLRLLGRRPVGLEGAADEVAPLADWPALAGGQPVDILISTLGTTWRKAGSWPAFEAVDHDAVLAVARAARRAGARHMLCLSSVGADPASANRYLAVKGRVETALTAIGWDRLDLVRPGLLRGRRENDRRPGEAFGQWVSPLVNRLLIGRLDKFAAIPAVTVAAAMAHWALATAPGRFVHHNRDIRAAARAG